MKNFQIGILLIAIFVSPLAHAEISSVYTDIRSNKCKLLSQDELTGAEVRQCKGVNGYTLQTLYDDQRVSVNVFTPQKTEHPLNYYKLVSSSFSHLGDKAEWRIIEKDGKKVPIALIIRFVALEVSNNDPDLPRKPISYLTVAKITSNEICVTDKLRATPNANEKARELADLSKDKPCLKP